MVAGRVFHQIEATPWAEVRRVKLEKLLTQLRYVQQHSLFYQEKFAAAGVDPGQHLPDLDPVHPAPSASTSPSPLLFSL